MNPSHSAAMPRVVRNQGGAATRGQSCKRGALAKRPAKTARDLRNASENGLADDINLLFDRFSSGL
jgi:hypothetical protein